MKVLLGYNSALLKNFPDKAEIFYDTKKLISGHICLSGKSGSGKTFTIKKILNLLQEAALKENGKSLRIHVIDVHGDIDIEGASSVKFSESTDFGFNPLIINKNPDFGGVRKRIQSFISSLNRTGFKLGANQEATLRNLLVDLYAANGIYEKDPNSWDIRKTGRKNPTIEDLDRFTNAKMKSMFLGTSGSGNNSCISSLEKVNRLQNKLFRKIKNSSKSNKEELEKIEDELDKVKQECIEQFTNYVNNITTGHELDDLLKYDSFDVMKSLSNKISNLNSIGIFKNKSPPFDANKNIWRYDIKSLEADEKALFVSFLCEQLFLRAVQRGEQDDVVEIIVLDEAHLFVNDDPKNPINVIAKEARKFGLALLAASQSPTHFSDDFLSNVSTKIILGVDQIYWSNCINRLKIPEEALKWIIFHKRILIQINCKGDVKNEFLWSYNSKEIYEQLNRNRQT
jgi:hypothetical protein